jgi:hypothetical protein
VRNDDGQQSTRADKRYRAAMCVAIYSGCTHACNAKPLLPGGAYAVADLKMVYHKMVKAVPPLRVRYIVRGRRCIAPARPS